MTALAPSPAATAPSTRDPVERFHWALLIAVLLAFVAAAVTFMKTQSLWVDESTQLRGIELGPVAVTKWLAGAPIKLDVPPDRTPPISYWLGWAWSQAFGLTEHSLRWLGLTCSTAAIVVVYATARRAFGTRAALAAAGFLALSANVITTAVEIRAYPVFLLVSSCACYFYIRAFADPNHRPRYALPAMTACMILAAYTHFFGVVFAACLSLAALVATYLTGRKFGPVLVACILAGIAPAGLIPFIRAAQHISNSSAQRESLTDCIRLVYRLVSHPSLSLHPIAVVAAAISTLILVLLSVFGTGGGRTIRIGTAVALFSGLGVSTISTFLIRGFVSTAPTYNVWMLPVLALLIGGGCMAAGARTRIMAAAAVVILFISSSFGPAELVRRGSYFAHCPQRQILAVVDSLPAGQVATVYDDHEVFGLISFAIQYVRNGHVPQYLTEMSPNHNSVRPLPPAGDPTPLVDLPFRYLVIVRSHSASARDLAQMIRNGYAPTDGPAVLTLLASGKWKCVSRHAFPAFATSDVAVFERSE